MLQHLELLQTPLSWALLILSLSLYVLNSFRRRRTPNKHSATSTQPSKGPSTEHSEEAYYSIPSDPSFSLTSTQPLKLRPFKPTYHMTMALESSSIPDLIAMDTSFPARCKIRSSLISTERPEVLACTPRGTAPVLELYSWLVGTYLPARFPSVYVRSERSGVKNEVTGEEMPLSVDDGMTALEILGRNVDDEFLLMLPGEHEGDEGRYRLEAFVNCFPSGFNTRKKLGMRLNEIHGPVPGYKAKLEKSMDRFFASLPIGKVVKRANWSISTNTDLFCLAGNHMSADDIADHIDEEIDLNKTVLRCERQTLHRLPKTRALVFAFKTYQYPIQEVRDEGSGEELAAAIDGLASGSVPDITIYKRQVVWGEKVKALLRGEIDA
ncbi:hypothetical protein IQ06DRAFT_293885 [Phaeosphaeriaceae sp. SRC1lsM3a]|nr:hypothetical protein IQ06DRAFT_293885 [Stagonospora sp. SRC1lsM3a]